MEFGTCPDGAHGGYGHLLWVQGIPDSNWLTGPFSRAQLKAAPQVITYRCPKCYRLEAFAPPAPQNP
jgi:hypothetical protein